MPIYLVRVGECGPVKIGMTRTLGDLANRLGNLQANQWEAIRLLRLWEGGVAEENRLHLQFADLRIRGEFFTFSRLMLGDVGLTPIDLPPERQADDPIQAKDIFGLIGGVKEVAVQCETSRAQVSRWMHDNQIPRDKWPVILRCAADLGIMNITTGVLDRMQPSGRAPRHPPGRKPQILPPITPGPQRIVLWKSLRDRRFTLAAIARASGVSRQRVHAALRATA